MSSSLRLRLRLANATVQSAGPSDSYFWHAGHFRHFSHFSAPAEGGAHETAGGASQGVRLNRVLGTSAPASGSAWGRICPMLGRKAGCEGVRTDFSDGRAMPRHRPIGPARFSPVDCEEAPVCARHKPLKDSIELSLRKNASCGRGLVTSDGSVCPLNPKGFGMASYG